MSDDQPPVSAADLRAAVAGLAELLRQYKFIVDADTLHEWLESPESRDLLTILDEIQGKPLPQPVNLTLNNIHNMTSVQGDVSGTAINVGGGEIDADRIAGGRAYPPGDAPLPEAQPPAGAQPVDPAVLAQHIDEYWGGVARQQGKTQLDQRFVNLSGEVQLYGEFLDPEDLDLPPDLPPDLARVYALDELLEADTAASAEPAAAGGAGKTYVQDVRARLLAMDRGVLVGEPGSGKTWMLRRLMLDYAAIWHGEMPDPVPDRAPLVPVFVPLNHYKGVDGRGHPQTFEQFVGQQAGALQPDLPALQAAGRLLLLCDALNEMPRQTASGGDLVAGMLDFLRRVGRFIVSCRVRDYDEELAPLKPLGLDRVLLHDLDLPAIHELLERYLGHRSLALWQAIGGSETLLGFWEKVSAAGRSADFWKAEAELASIGDYNGWRAWQRMYSGARLIPLVRSPYLGFLLCHIYMQRGKNLPESRVDLFGTFVDLLLADARSRAKGQSPPFPPEDAIKDSLRDLARAMQADSVTVIDASAAAAAVNLPDAGALLRAAAAASLLTAGGEQWRFTHQLLQEYFAVRVLAEALQAGQSAAAFFGAAWWDAGVWRETTVILGEFLSGAQGANQAAQWLAEASPEVAVDVFLRNPGGLTLADITPQTRQALVNGAKARTAEPDVRGRAVAYRVLGMFGADDRPGVGLTSAGLPEIDWVPVRGGEFIYQDGERQFLETFYIARYPVTYRQFQAFVDAPDYNDARWWAGFPVMARELSQQAFPFANHPRERVTWYQAVAFCRWLSDKTPYLHLSAPAAGEAWVITLPTEQQWEKAARGTDGRVYPWGAKYLSGCANIDETYDDVGPYYLQRTTAVGIYPLGKSPSEVYDLSGNVWEWCLNKYNAPEETQPDASGEKRVVRGGSWSSDQGLARAAYRSPRDPASRGDNRGFRVAAVITASRPPE